ncbi:MAG: M81 family metallopeptidase [Alphaproteobacteria bacterium]|nr:M81 family metallopeptidase [Alphaproteobacteria bacterium]
MQRIAVGGFQHETNTFAPQRATWDDFARADAWPGFVRGPALFDAVVGYNIPIAGAVEALRALGHELVPLCWCAAPPSSYVDEDAYERVAAAMLEDLAAAGALDGIYLDLHGAMVAAHLEDGEGELLRRIRALVGDRIPIVASLDFHTNMTPEMVRYSSALVGYRTYPHIDMAETGGRAARLLDRLLRDNRPLCKAFRQVDFLIPLVWQCTMAEPTRGVFALIDEIERGSAPGGPSHNQGIVGITHTPGFPPADIAQCGPALVVYGYDQETADAAADRLLAAIEAREAEFAGRLYTADEAAEEAIRLSQSASKPVVLADIQDNPGAGGTSDTVGLLRALIAHKAAGAVIGMIVDPEAAAAAHAAGEGALLPCGVGAKVGYGGETPVEARWRAVRLGDGRFTGTGPFYGGAKFDIGPMALITDEDSGVSAVLAAKRIQAADQEMFRHVGIEPSQVPILALKSTVHFRADFQPIAEAVLCVVSPGAHVSDPVELPYERLRPGVRLRPLGPKRI